MAKSKEDVEKQAESIANIAKNIMRDSVPHDKVEEQPISDLKPNVVMIEWIDVQSIQEGLIYPHEMDLEPVHCFLVGFLVKETESNYYLAKEYWDSGQCKYLHIIPKNTAIVKISTMHK